MNTETSPPPEAGHTDCQVVCDLLPLLVGGDETDQERIAQAEAHLGECGHCRVEHGVYQVAYRALREAGAARREAECAANGYTVDLWPAVVRKLNDAGAPPGGHGFSWRSQVILGIAAVFLFVLGLGISFQVGQNLARQGDQFVEAPSGEGPMNRASGATGGAGFAFPLEIYSHRQLVVPTTPSDGATDSHYLQREFVPISSDRKLRF